MANTRIFIDSRVNDLELLISQFTPGTSYQVLDARLDGIEQIVSALAGEGRYDSIQIISHGASGEITLGNTLLNSAALYRYAGKLATIGASLSSTGDILLYGCNVGAGDAGLHFVDTLAQLTGADVAASDDVTGSAALGGDWVLEVQSGTIESTVPPLIGIDGKLANRAPSFFLGGIVITDFGFKDDYGSSVAVLSTGIILVAGTSNSDFAIVKYNSNGLIDKNTIDINPDHNIASSDNAYSIAVGKSGGIYIAGTSSYIGFNTTLSQRAFVIVQYPVNPDWFGYSGRTYVTAGYGSIYGGSLAVNTSGSTIYLTGNIIGTDGGVYVTSFKNNGDWSGVSKTFKFDSKSPSVAQSIAVQNDGDVLVAGYCSTNSLNNDFAIVRCNSDLSFDTTFSFDGEVTTDLGGDDYCYSVALQSDGKILVAGYSSTNVTSDISYFAIVRYNTNGSLDTTFGSKGFVTTDLGLYNRDFGQSVAVQNDGKILVAGYCYAGYSYGYDFALVRYNSDGSLDTTFDYDGKVITELGGDDYGYSVTVQTDGKILVAGTSRNASTGNNDFALVRYNSDGSLDTTFGANALNGHSIYTERSNAIILDNDVQVFDAELAALDNYGGATLTLERHSGASADDHFSGDGIVAGNANGTVTIADINIGSYTWNSGKLVITFNKSATQSLVNQAMQSLRYANANDAPPSSVQIDWTFSDGDNTGALSTMGSTPVTIISLNDAPTLTAFAAAVDSTAQNITVEISYADLAAQGDEADDDIVMAFIVKSLSTGTLTIGTNATTAMEWNAATNNTIDVTHHAYWTPVTDSTGALNAFIVVVKDNSGIESRNPVQARVHVLDTTAPTLTSTAPSNNATGVAVGSNIVLTFSEAIQRGSGAIAIHAGSPNGTVVESYDAATSTSLTIAGITLTINPSADLAKGTHYFVTFENGNVTDLAGNHYVGTNTYDFITEALPSVLHDLTGNITFWKTGAPITGVTSSLTTVSAVTSTQPIEFRNIHLAADGSRTIEIWVTSSKSDIGNVDLDVTLPTGSVATWQDATGLPSGWTSVTNTENPGMFILAGMGVMVLSSGSVQLGTLTLTAPANPQHFELLLNTGLLGNDTIPSFGLSSDSMTTALDGLYQHLDMVDGTYALTSAKISGTAESNAIKSNDALAALKIAVGINPNSDGSAVSPYQYLAADVNHDGAVKAVDARDILRMAVKLSTAPEKEWLFVPESVGSETMSRSNVLWPDNPIPVTLDADQDLHLIGIVSGDVNGSWVA